MANKNRAPAENNPAWRDVKAVYDGDTTPDSVRRVWKMGSYAGLAKFAPNAFAMTEQNIKGWLNPPPFRSFKRMMVNNMLGTHGIEYLGECKRTGQSVYYCNVGDTYAATVVFCGGVLSVSCLGDWIESNKIKAGA